MGAPNFPVSRQRREHGSTPRALERKSQEIKKKEKEKKESATHLLREFKYLCNVIKNNKIPAKQGLSFKGNLRSAAS